MVKEWLISQGSYLPMCYFYTRNSSMGGVGRKNDNLFRFLQLSLVLTFILILKRFHIKFPLPNYIYFSSMLFIYDDMQLYPICRIHIFQFDLFFKMVIFYLSMHMHDLSILLHIFYETNLLLFS